MTMTKESTCASASRNCELLIALNEHHTQRCALAAITGPDAVVKAAAVGLVIEVWRNGPVEDMRAGRRGPSDAAMFAESTALHREAVKALTAGNRAFGLIDFERHLLDRTRSWAGTGGKTLKDLGFGFLGEYQRHVKDRVNALMTLDKHSCVDAVLEVYLINRALVYGRHHKGMPRWTQIVDRVGVLLTDPNHPAWRDPDHGAHALATMPLQASSLDQLTANLREEPSTLPVDVLDWLSDHLFYCAGPPYSPTWEE